MFGRYRIWSGGALEMRRSAVVLLCSMVAAAVLGGTGPLAQSANADNSRPDALEERVGEFSLSQLVASGDAQRAANAVEEFASQRYVDLYSGVSLTNGATQVVVWLTERDPQIEAEIQGAIPAAELEFEVRESTQASQLSAHQKILEAVDALNQIGIVVGEFGPDPVTGKERVTVLGGTDAQLAQVEEMFGPALTAVSVPETTRATPDAASRHVDAPSWNAGDFISNGSEDCTSGIPTHNAAGQQFLVTAAHCFTVGSSVFNKSASIPLGAGGYLGTVVARDLRNNAFDAELVSAPSSNLTFTGGTSTTTKAAFGGAGAPVVGALVCSSGAFEGERCLTIISVNSCLSNSITGLGRTVCAENYYYGSLDQSIGQGDSGGPVYAYGSGGVRAMGLHNLHDPHYEVRCTNWSPQTHRTCSGHGWFVSIGPVMGTWGLAVN
ncbi:S1 family peptidase [Herbiconiux daphne]|uniref:S1 family peptidase n=1 Tax=Herbiconiux daphne TaxID=2970914 RepID=A0ABT2GY36_9MICO|nr:S1 family peptidase [Herbiconiux daphne]MCS5732873.1 S1 family peptidase [Herbiconiux daphne]